MADAARCGHSRHTAGSAEQGVGRARRQSSADDRGHLSAGTALAATRTRGAPAPSFCVSMFAASSTSQKLAQKLAMGGADAMDTIETQPTQLHEPSSDGNPALWSSASELGCGLQTDDSDELIEDVINEELDCGLRTASGEDVVEDAIDEVDPHGSTLPPDPPQPFEERSNNMAAAPTPSSQVKSRFKDFATPKRFCAPVAKPTANSAVGTTRLVHPVRSHVHTPPAAGPLATEDDGSIAPSGFAAQRSLKLAASHPSEPGAASAKVDPTADSTKRSRPRPFIALRATGTSSSVQLLRPQEKKPTRRLEDDEDVPEHEPAPEAGPGEPSWMLNGGMRKKHCSFRASFRPDSESAARFGRGGAKDQEAALRAKARGPKFSPLAENAIVLHSPASEDEVRCGGESGCVRELNGPGRCHRMRLTCATRVAHRSTS